MARETYPHECCGALLGRDGVVPRRRWPLPNTTEEGPRRRFLVARRTTAPPRRVRSDEGVELLGFYHSHPDHPARPSQYDLDHAWPVFSYVIISVAEGRPGGDHVVAAGRRSVAVSRRKRLTCPTARESATHADEDSDPDPAARRSPTSRTRSSWTGTTVGELLAEPDDAGTRALQAAPVQRARAGCAASSTSTSTTRTSATCRRKRRRSRPATW